MDVNVKCAISYLPYESMIDRQSFEYFLMRCLPQHLVLCNGSPTKYEHLLAFAQKNGLNIGVHHCSNNTASKVFEMATESATRTVFLDTQLARSLAFQKVNSFEGVHVCRVSGRLNFSGEEPNLLVEGKQKLKQNYLFILPKEYRLQELQHALSMQLNIHTDVIDGCLCFQNKVYLWFEQG